MAVNLELYRVFREVAEAGSFSEAARRMILSQSAVSQAVAQLETQLGVRLFFRTRRGARLTAEGEALRTQVEAALELFANAEGRMARMRKLQEGELVIGAGDAISEHFLLPVLARYQRKYPGIRLQVVNRTTEQAVALLKAGSIDLAFGNLPLEDAELAVRPCMQVHDVFVAAPSLPDVPDGPLTPAALANCRLVMLERLSLSRCYVDRCFLQAGVRLKPEIELGTHDLLLEFARVGLGVSCVIREFATRYLENGELVELPLAPALPPRAIGLYTLAGAALSEAARVFITLLA